MVQGTLSSSTHITCDSYHRMAGNIHEGRQGSERGGTGRAEKTKGEGREASVGKGGEKREEEKMQWWDRMKIGHQQADLCCGRLTILVARQQVEHSGPPKVAEAQEAVISVEVTAAASGWRGDGLDWSAGGGTHLDWQRGMDRAPAVWAARTLPGLS